MKASVFEELCCVLASSGLEGARAKYTDVPLDTLLSIQSQENTRKIRLNHHRLRHPTLIHQYIVEYVSGKDILAISTSSGINPCFLVRILLEHLFGFAKHQITECMKDPGRLPQERIREVAQNFHNLHPQIFTELESMTDFFRKSGSLHISCRKLQEDLYRCMDNDDCASPFIELVRRTAGIEYEAYLCRQLQAIGIPFQTESALRAAGFSKTPDVKLEVPIAVQGRIVNWIDSKASFGDEFSHKNQADQQFQRYVNRFGPGMVIYWFGFVEELNDHPDVMMLENFPARNDIYCLPSLNIQPRP